MRPGFPERGSFGDKFSEIERRLQALESANRLTSASIGSGGLRIKDGGTIESGGYVAGTSGYQLAASSAEFNDIVVRGDIESGNWDGASPANLSSRDTGATQGFYLDSSEGAAQFEGSVWVGGETTLTGNLTLSGGSIRTSASGERIEIIDTPPKIEFYESGGSLEGVLQVSGGTALSAQNGLVLSAVDDAILRGRQASGTEARIVAGDGTSEYLTVQLFDAFTVLTDLLVLTDTTLTSSVVGNDTTGSGANAHITTGGRIQRSTSSLKFKPDWQWAKDAADVILPTPIRWTDEKGQIRLGFGAEHIYEAVPEAYEDEIYDLRSLVAVLSEKVKRLEAAWR